jgi:hypothetical protein
LSSHVLSDASEIDLMRVKGEMIVVSHLRSDRKGDAGANDELYQDSLVRGARRRAATCLTDSTVDIARGSIVDMIDILASISTQLTNKRRSRKF